MRRSEEDQEIIDRGKLWIEFKNTEWFKDLSLFLNTQIDNLKESVVMLTLNLQYEDAKCDAQKLLAYKEVKSFIENDAVEKMKELIDGEQAERNYKDGIPSHVG
jgi:hypothetical protein